MLYFERIDSSKGIDPAKSNNSKKCIVCHYCFFNHGFKFQNSNSNDSLDSTMLFLNVSNIDIITVKSVDYCCIIHDISKSDAIHFLKDFVLMIVGICKNIYERNQYQKSSLQVLSRQFNWSKKNQKPKLF